MNDKIVDLLKSRDFSVPSLLFKNYKKLNLTDFELIVIIYFLNNSCVFNPKEVSLELDVNLGVLMETISSLGSKGYLKIEMTKNKVKEEIINTDGLYKKMLVLVINEEKKVNTNLYDIFETEFGRTLSPMDFEIIASLQKDNSDELITLALKEAVFNGVKNLNYVSKILYNWEKKGIKSEEDIIINKKEFQTKKTEKLFDYDWLNE